MATVALAPPLPAQPIDTRTLPFFAATPVAHIKGRPLSPEHFNVEAERIARTVPTPLVHQLVSEYEDYALERTIAIRLIELECEDEGVEVTEAEVDAEFARQFAGYSEPKALEQLLERSHQTLDELRRELARDIAVRKLLRARGPFTPTPEQVRAHYDAHIDRYTTAAQVEASHILIKLSRDPSEAEVEAAKTRAEELAARANSPGADFAALAKEHSECPSAQRGGELGYFPRSKMVAPFSDVAFELKVGEVSGAVRTRYGFHVIEVTGRQDARIRSFDEVEAQITQSLGTLSTREEKEALVEELRDEYDVEEHPEAIVTREPGTPGP